MQIDKKTKINDLQIASATPMFGVARGLNEGRSLTLRRNPRVIHLARKANTHYHLKNPPPFITLTPGLLFLCPYARLLASFLDLSVHETLFSLKLNII